MFSIGYLIKYLLMKKLKYFENSCEKGLQLFSNHYILLHTDNLVLRNHKMNRFVTTRNTKTTFNNVNVVVFTNDRDNNKCSGLFEFQCS